MAGTQFDEAELLALVNEGLSEDDQVDNGQELIDLIYGEDAAQGLAEIAANRVTADQLRILINRVMNNNKLVNSFARIMGMRTNEMIVSLINSHNPYTSNSMADMTIYTGNPDFSQWADNRPNQIEVEVDGPYTTPKEWYFKSLPQQINKALRVKYRYQAVDLGAPAPRPPIKPPHWITAYMLIGYEDGGA